MTYRKSACLSWNQPLSTAILRNSSQEVGSARAQYYTGTNIYDINHSQQDECNKTDFVLRLIGLEDVIQIASI